MFRTLAAALAMALATLPALAADMASVSRALVFGPPAQTRTALETITRERRTDALPALILGMRYAGRGEMNGAYTRAFTALTGTQVDGWFDAMLWQEAHPEIKPHPSYRQIKLDSLRRIDPAFMRFLGGERSDPAKMTIRLEEITWGGVKVDGIPSLDNPALVGTQEAGYLVGDDLVFGIEINGDARAYPLRIMGWHEMFNDVIGGKPVALAYCTLCGAGVLFDTTLPGFDEPLVFGSSGFLYRSNKLMFDRRTDSLWNQFTGKPVAGPLVNRGIELKTLPVAITSWAEWQRKHPDTKVLSLRTGHRRDYGSGVVYNDYFGSQDLMFPSLGGGKDLAQKDYVFGLRLPGGAKAYPLRAFEGGRAINDRVGLRDVVLVGDAATRTVRAYATDGRRFTGSGETLTDPGGMVWQVGEESLVAPTGQRLPRLPGHIAYWFGWQSFTGGQSEFYDG